MSPPCPADRLPLCGPRIWGPTTGAPGAPGEEGRRRRCHRPSAGRGPPGAAPCSRPLCWPRIGIATCARDWRRWSGAPARRRDGRRAAASHWGAPRPADGLHDGPGPSPTSVAAAAPPPAPGYAPAKRCRPRPARPPAEARRSETAAWPVGPLAATASGSRQVPVPQRWGPTRPATAGPGLALGQPPSALPAPGRATPSAAPAGRVLARPGPWPQVGLPPFCPRPPDPGQAAPGPARTCGPAVGAAPTARGGPARRTRFATCPWSPGGPRYPCGQTVPRSPGLGTGGCAEARAIVREVCDLQPTSNRESAAGDNRGKPSDSRAGRQTERHGRASAEGVQGRRGPGVPRRKTPKARPGCGAPKCWTHGPPFEPHAPGSNPHGAPVSGKRAANLGAFEVCRQAAGRRRAAAAAQKTGAGPEAVQLHWTSPAPRPHGTETIPKPPTVPGCTPPHYVPTVGPGGPRIAPRAAPALSSPASRSGGPPPPPPGPRVPRGPAAGPLHPATSRTRAG